MLIVTIQSFCQLVDPDFKLKVGNYYTITVNEKGKKGFLLNMNDSSIHVQDGKYSFGSLVPDTKISFREIDSLIILPDRNTALAGIIGGILGVAAGAVLGKSAHSDPVTSGFNVFHLAREDQLYLEV
jgi:hypothetical protein